MKIVVDSHGEKITGLLRDDNGILVVSDPISLAKYESRISKEKEIAQLKQDVSELRNLINEFKQMMETNNG